MKMENDRFFWARHGCSLPASSLVSGARLGRGRSSMSRPARRRRHQTPGQTVVTMTGQTGVRGYGSSGDGQTARSPSNTPEELHLRTGVVLPSRRARHFMASAWSRFDVSHGLTNQVSVGSRVFAMGNGFLAMSRGSITNLLLVIRKRYLTTSARCR